MRAENVPFPNSIILPESIRSALLHVASLAHYAVIQTRSWCANSSIARVRLAGKLERAENEMALLKEEIRIKDARMARIPAKNRPFYPPTERMAVLEMKAARGWNLRQTAAAFLVEPETIASWLKRLDQEGPDAVVIDHFSRKVMGFAVFKYPPSSLEIRSFLGRAMSRNRAKPKYIVCDPGTQFDCDAFRKWAKRKKIKPRYGAVGKYGSIAVIERFIRSMKNECTRMILVPMNLREMRAELSCYATWYNHFRPHQSLQGQTPQNTYDGKDPPPRPNRPNSRLPEMRLIVTRFKGRKHLPVVELKQVKDPEPSRRAA